MSREFRIPHEEIKDSQKITAATEAHFESHGLDIHRHEVEHLEDDFKKGLRILRVKNRKYFFMR